MTCALAAILDFYLWLAVAGLSLAVLAALASENALLRRRLKNIEDSQP